MRYLLLALLLPLAARGAWNPAFAGAFTNAEISVADAWSNVFWATRERCEATFRYQYTDATGTLVRVYGVEPLTVVATNTEQDSSAMVVCGIATQGAYIVTNWCPSVVTNITTNGTAEITTRAVAEATLAKLKQVVPYYVPMTSGVPQSLALPASTNWEGGAGVHWQVENLWNHIGVGSVYTNPADGSYTVYFTAQTATRTQAVVLADLIRGPSKIVFTNAAQPSFSGEYEWQGEHYAGPNGNIIYSAAKDSLVALWLLAKGNARDEWLWWTTTSARDPVGASPFYLIPAATYTAAVYAATNSYTTGLCVARGLFLSDVVTRTPVTCSVYVVTTQALSSPPSVTVSGARLVYTNGAYAVGDDSVTETVLLSTNAVALTNLYHSITSALLSAEWPGGADAIWVGYNAPMQYDDLSWHFEKSTLLEAYRVLTNLTTTAPDAYVFERESAMPSGGVVSDLGCQPGSPPGSDGMNRTLAGTITEGPRMGWSDRWTAPYARSGEYDAFAYRPDVAFLAWDRGVYASAQGRIWVEPFVFAPDGIGIQTATFWAIRRPYVMRGLGTARLTNSAPQTGWTLLASGVAATESATNSVSPVGSWTNRAVVRASAPVSLESDVLDAIASASSLPMFTESGFGNQYSPCLSDYLVEPEDGTVTALGWIEGARQPGPNATRRAVLTLIEWDFQYR